MKYWIEIMRESSVTGVVDANAVRIAVVEDDSITSDVSGAIGWAHRTVGTDAWDYLNLVSDFVLPDQTIVREFQSRRIANPARNFQKSGSVHGLPQRSTTQNLY